MGCGDSRDMARFLAPIFETGRRSGLRVPIRPIRRVMPGKWTDVCSVVADDVGPALVVLREVVEVGDDL